jgi:wyosine [tRNA(Phe)-imidazoG37] synthetase (radical SAM superfamily)
MANGKNVPIDPKNAPAGYYHHPRRFLGSRMVYPVLSRRSRGVSIGVNLFPCKLCNFNCLYCQVLSENDPKGVVPKVDPAALERELREMLEMAAGGKLYEHEPFSKAPAELRRLNDIALSGDGEPTLIKEFAEVCRVCVSVKTSLKLGGVKVILLTNASRLHLPAVERGLDILYGDEGEIWAKLDAGTEAYFQFLNQASIPYDVVLNNIIRSAKIRPIVIQSLFVRVDGNRTAPAEVRAYAEQLKAILSTGGTIRQIQIYTVARPCRDPRISRLSREELEQITAEIQSEVAVPLVTYYN